MDKSSPVGKTTFYARVIPNRGAWIEVDTIRTARPLSASIRSAKSPVTNLTGSRLHVDPDRRVVTHAPVEITIEAKPFLLEGLIAPIDIYPPTGGRAIVRKGETVDRETSIRLAAAYPDGLTLPYEIEPFPMDKSMLETYEQAFPALDRMSRPIRNCRTTTPRFWTFTRSFDRATLPLSKPRGLYWNARFFDERRYDLSPVGRFKMNKKLGLSIPPSVRYLTSSISLKLSDIWTRMGPARSTISIISAIAESVGQRVDPDHFRKACFAWSVWPESGWPIKNRKS